MHPRAEDMHGRSVAAGQYPLLKPALQAYALGLLSTTTPQVFSLLLSGIRGTLSIHDAVSRAYRIVRRQLALEQFPTACAITLGGATLLPKIFWFWWFKIQQHKRSTHNIRSSRLDACVKFLSSFIAAWASFELLNRHKSRPLKAKRISSLSATPLRDEGSGTDVSGFHSRRRRSSVVLGTQGAIVREPPTESSGLAGRTLDLTLFVSVRAADVVVTSIWAKTAEKVKTQQSSKLRSFVEKMIGPSIFALASSLIMWSWFFSPDRLPRSYNTWIASVAQIDARLIEALRQCRYGRFVYGKDTGLAPLLQSMCKDLKYPLEWGDPAKTIPIPCELYHSGAGSSCEWHAVTRFTKAWKFAMHMYLPLNLLILLRRKPSRRSTSKAFMEASQSSAFLGAFVALFYYGVCLARTRVGPKIFSRQTITPMMWDGGLCVGTGCMLCGWSIFLEKAARRQEIAFFVTPRALATVISRRYDRKHLWQEQAVFAISTAIVLTAAQTTPNKVRGVFGRLIGQLFK